MVASALAFGETRRIKRTEARRGLRVLGESERWQATLRGMTTFHIRIPIRAYLRISVLLSHTYYCTMRVRTMSYRNDVRRETTLT
jgi:hypothetical protein